jgi:hypothetical protein
MEGCCKKLWKMYLYRAEQWNAVADVNMDFNRKTFEENYCSSTEKSNQEIAKK